MGVSLDSCYVWLSTNVSVHKMSSWYHSRLPWRSPWLGPSQSQQSPGDCSKDFVNWVERPVDQFHGLRAMQREALKLDGTGQDKREAGKIRKRADAGERRNATAFVESRKKKVFNPKVKEYNPWKFQQLSEKDAILSFKKVVLHNKVFNMYPNLN